MSDTNKLNSYLAAWDLSNPQLLTQTATSHIYTVTHNTETVILKLLSPSETEEQRGALALRYFDGRGAVRVLRYDQGAHLMEYAAGDELVTLVERGEDENATRIIAQVIKQLHSVPQKLSEKTRASLAIRGEKGILEGRPPQTPLFQTASQDAPRDGLLPLERWFGELFSKAAADRQAGIESIYVRSAALTERLLADQREVRVLHGDIHHRNIRQSPRGWLAFDPKGIVGERTYDCANTLCNPVMPELVHNETRLLTNAAILADMLALDLSRVLAFTYAYACLNASWWLRIGGKDGEDIVEWALKVAVIIEPHIELL